MSVREVQKALRFSSPSVAHHHLEQLRQLGLVQRQDVGGTYSLVSEVKIGVLRHLVRLERLLFPRYFFYTVFSTVSITFFGAIVSAILWYEALRFWRLKPF